MASRKGKTYNTGRTHFPKGVIPWNKGLKGVPRLKPLVDKVDGRLKGHKHTEETKEYLRTINAGRIPPNKGKKYSGALLEKMREVASNNRPNGWTYERWMSEFPKVLVTALKQALNNDYEPYNNHSWRKLRKSVYQRDGFICQECGCQCNDKTGISCHHIDFDRGNNDMMNLITLCSSCHGKTTQKPDEWIQYYQDKMLLNKNNELKSS